jgi:formylglycine-generating enzyme required for sulfatase activity/tRNA A-37 threonylcarbamoyl transferase component Bud32
MKTCPTCQQTYSDDVEFCPRDGSPLPPDSFHRVIPADAGIQTDANLAAGLSRRFRIVRRLGAGAMGTVFLAEQIAVGNRAVALKVLNRKLLDDPEFLLRFQNEAASTGRIHHANVVTIYESGQADDGTPYIAMEFLEGESLRQALTRRGALPLPEVAEILQQAARGLNAAHKLGIIHRDLKPDNIFLTRGDEGETVVKVVDFGIAKLRESGAHTQTGMVLGTPAYMSFEQASGMRSDELDARSDIYSLGVLTYEMLTGRTPFQSDTPVGFLRKHMMEEPPPFRTVAPGLGAPPAVESAVMGALTKDRDQRYPSVLHFARELTSAAQASPRDQAPLPLPSALIVSPPVAELSEPVVSTRIVRSLGQSPPDRRGATKVNPKDGLKYLWVPPGTFMMGCSLGDNEWCKDDEKPTHSVTISKGFWMGQTEVTVGAYKRFAAAMGRQMPLAPEFNSGWTNDNMPMVMVTWEDAGDYCTWAGGRLPTEAEWEYAARGGSAEARYGNLDETAWYWDNCGDPGQPYEVAQKRANGLGLFDVLGNVWEWVNDWYDEKYYQSSPTQDPPGPMSGQRRVVRGGSWVNAPGYVRVSVRDSYEPGSRISNYGFRCAREVGSL